VTNNYRSKDYISKKRNAGEWKEELKNGLNFEKDFHSLRFLALS